MAAKETGSSGELPAFFEAAGRRLEYRWIGPPPTDAPTLVFLHEGLGSVALWRDFPDRLASATGCGAFVYSRRGYGASEPQSAPRSTGFMHDEALEVLPAVVARFELADFLLFGHSDGASIAIVYAGSLASSFGRAQEAGSSSLRGLVLEAPHVFIETVCVDSIARIARAYETTRLPERLARYHGDNTESMFRTWTDVWLRPEFALWNIEEYLPPIEVPILVVQGERDEYGTLRQVEAVVRQVRGPARTVILPDCGHSPHSEQPDAVLEAAAGFIRETLDMGL